MIGASAGSANHIATDGSNGSHRCHPIDPWGIKADNIWTEIPSSHSTEIPVMPLGWVPIPSNFKFKGHSTGNGWFIANPHPEIKFPG
jgi:hypothetical protein